MFKRFACAAALTSLLLCPSAQTSAQTQPAAAQPPAPKAEEKASSPTWKISGYMFGDYYLVPNHRKSTIEGQNGFWFRRIYLTYDHTWTKALSTRFRLEMNSPGNFSTKASLTPYVKDAYLKYTSGRHAVLFGIAPTPTFEFIEGVWGYRSVEKTPLDLYKWDSSRDFGITVQGALNAGKTLNYTAQIGNGSGTTSETDKEKVVRGAVNYRAKSGLLLEGYVDRQNRLGTADYSTWHVFAGFQKATYRLGGQYASQSRHRATPTAADLNLTLFSVFAAAKVSSRVNAFARVDRNFDPVPGGETIDYLPFSDQAKSMLTILGLDFSVDKPLRIQPNIEIVSYGKDSQGLQVPKDVNARVTVYFTW